MHISVWVRRRAPMQNAEGRMQNFLGDDAIEVQTVGDDGLACGLMFATRIALCNN